ncbi:hypothetical protein DBY65_005665 [Pseudomonas sp. RIT412]|nr:hypothetical protein DBP26_005000 [Pseudomonas sp. RIT 409]RAU55398.1 hypothetical protein DBY65_005665 [Pseudomonas sp. RIT 412]
MFLSDPREEILSDHEKVYRPLHAWPRVDTSETYYMAFVVDEDVSICPACVLLSTQASLIGYLTDCQNIDGLIIQELFVVMPPHQYNGERWLNTPITELSASYDMAGNLQSILYQTEFGEFAEFLAEPKYEDIYKVIYIAKSGEEFPISRWNY